MKNIRIGNDIIIGWTLYDVLGNPYQLKEEFKLSLKCGNYSLDITDYTVEDNKVTFMFYGKDQTVTGVYTLTLIENDDEVGMHTVDCCKVFRMVNTSCESNDYNAINPEVESLDLHSKIDYFPPVTIDKELSGTSENPVQNKVITSKITIIDENITSINDDINNINNNVTQLDTELNKTVVELKATDEKITKEKAALVNGDTIVGQAREIHSRNGKTVTDSFLARTTAGSGTIGDGVATLKSVGGNIVKNLVDKDWVFVVNLGKWQTMGNTTHKVNGAFINVKFNTTWIGIQSKQNLISSHKYYMAVRALGNLDNLVLMCGGISKQFKLVGVWRFVSGIFSDLSGELTTCSIRASVVGEATFYNPIFIDLTEMFGVGNEPDKATCDKLFGTMDALPQGLNFAKPTEFKSTGFNQFNTDNVLEDKAIVDNGIVNGDKKIAVIPCLPCKVGVGENNGYCIHGDFGDDIKVYLTPLNPMEVDGELYMHELTKDATTDTYVPLINGYMLVEVPTTVNLCAHFLWSEDACDRDSYEPYFESKIELPTIPQMSEYGLAGIQSSGNLACDEIDFERGVYRKKIKDVELSQHGWWAESASNQNVYFADLGSKTNGVQNALSCERYTLIKFNALAFGAMPDKCMMFSGRYLYIRDNDFATNTAFRNSLTGLYVYYAMATPEEYPLPKVDNNYISSDYGVEQFDSVVPCNANNLYYMRSLAGETRNFLDRLYHNTNKSDANEVADYITNEPNLVLRALFVADGAEYNDTNEDITKTTPWGDSYIHKTKCYSFNGVGDITEAEMISIYNAGKLIKQNYYNYRQLNIKTTLNVPFNGGEANGIDLSGVYASSKVQILCLTKYGLYGHYFYPSNLDSAFSGCTELKKIVPILKLMFIISPSYYRNTFYNCKFLEDVKLDGLKHSISFAQSSIISKESILFAINKAVPTTAITITLHPDAYARLANDADIVAALTAQPLVTLVSA